jgi:hypothetical protein
MSSKYCSNNKNKKSFGRILELIYINYLIVLYKRYTNNIKYSNGTKMCVKGPMPRLQESSGP